ncbi:HutD family protein [Thalassotalea sp. HSM 43]|uniref:HutD/Ves family protein n=1 Tax=Thalassotalea sp. HSM 43 TaxID=2552945 RepID=UPI001080A01F|nr:HutD family protein [Thalassotalea sp. HSM 43]QBY05762.1 HutD family protein [Thalassotalea sp. HSM 43]
MKQTIISPNAFKTIAWKNGKGNTIELAINEGASLADFKWRISMADVVENGEFSDFSGYLRNLVLIKGNSISLEHDKQATDILDQHLSFATFDGSNKTYGKLANGAITDFNIITCRQTYHTEVFTCIDTMTKQLPPCDIAFVYGLTSPIDVRLNNAQQTFSLKPNHLLKYEFEDNQHVIQATGREMIIVCLTEK